MNEQLFAQVGQVTPSVLPEKFAEKIFLSAEDLTEILNQRYNTTLSQLKFGLIPGAVKIGKNWKVSRAVFESAFFAESGAPRRGHGHDGK